MFIRKNKKNENFIKKIDAFSRMIVWSINHADSPQIAKLGFSKNAEGIVNRNGNMVIKTDNPGLILQVSTEGYCNQIRPYQNYNYLSEAEYLTNFPDYNGFCVYKKFWDIHPPMLINFFQAMGWDNVDPVYFLNQLNISRQNMDDVSGPKLYRSFTDSAPYNYGVFSDFSCTKADGTFSAIYDFIEEDIFEIKIYKYPDLPEEYKLPFKPTTSSVFIPNYFNNIFATDAFTVKYNNNVLDAKSMGWLCIVDNVDNLDWEKLTIYSSKASILWSYFPDDTLLSKNNFEETLAIVTAAKKRDIHLNITKAIATEPAIASWYYAKNELLQEKQIKEIARKYNISLDPIWSDLPGEIIIDNSFKIIPEIWEWEYCSCFYGKNIFKFMEKMIEYYASHMNKKILIIVPRKLENKGRQFIQINKEKVLAATYATFDYEKKFLKKIKENAAAIFIMESKKTKENLNEDMLKICLKANLPIGIFSDDENANMQWNELADECYYLKLLKNTFIAKAMNTETVKNYDFSGTKLKVTPGNEKDMNKGE